MWKWKIGIWKFRKEKDYSKTIPFLPPPHPQSTAVLLFSDEDFLPAHIRLS